MEITDVYISSLKVSNYKSLKDCDVSFCNGLNILIGKNGAGKSNLLEFLYQNIYRTLRGEISRSLTQSFSASIEYKKDEKQNKLDYTVVRNKSDHLVMNGSSMFNYELSFKMKFDNQIVYEKQEPLNRLRRENDLLMEIEYYKDIRKISSTSQDYIKFQIPNNLQWIDNPAKIIIDNYNGISFSQEEVSNSNFFINLEFGIINEFHNLTSKTRNNIPILKNKISKLLKKYINNSQINGFLKNFTPIQEIRFSQNINIFKAEDNLIIENVYVEFLVYGDWIPWSYLSDGTKRLFYLVIETISTGAGTIVIEEPEIGVHPHQLYKILEFLQEQSKTKQIIISTHSPLSLDILKEDELDRIILAKNEDGSKFRHLTEAEKKKAKRYMNEVGDLSYFWLHSDLEK